MRRFRSLTISHPWVPPFETVREFLQGRFRNQFQSSDKPVESVPGSGAVGSTFLAARQGVKSKGTIYCRALKVPLPWEI